MESFVSVARAQQLILASTERAKITMVEPRRAYQRILAADLYAQWDVPQADLSVMDGWAICSTASSNELFLKRYESAAGHPVTARLSPGDAARVSTGAVIPKNAIAVVAQEEVEDQGTHIRIPPEIVAELKPGRMVRPRGSEIQRGQCLLPAGTYLQPGELALLCGCGHSTIPIYRPPKVALLSSGDELVPVGTSNPSPEQVINSNGLMLALQIQEAGGEVIDLGIIQDNPEQLRQALQVGLEADMLITSGGISVGDHDLVYDCLQSLGLQTLFRKVQMRPGKPTTFGCIDNVAIFALPGNPASSHVAFELFVRPALRKYLGFPASWLRPVRRAILQGSVLGEKTRESYARAYIDDRQVTPLEQQSSGSLLSICGHNALIMIPAGKLHITSGTEVDVLLLDG